jgi:MurNAc alpha-1-phosphate uridylyltransferase
LEKAGFKEIVINIAYLGYQIKEYLGDGSKFGVKIIFSDEQNEGALETAGGIVKALPYLSETFLVVNGDVWTDYEFTSDHRLEKNALSHLVLVQNPEHNPQGDFVLSGTNDKYTFSGIGYYKKELFANLKYGKAPLAPLLFEAIANEQVTTELHQHSWYDIGTPERLRVLDEALLREVYSTEV